MKNVVLIGMPGAGKSTIGVLLAKSMLFSFVDTDLIIQSKHSMSLCEIIAQKGTNEFLEIENQTISDCDFSNCVIATGGSAVYGEKAMQKLKKDGIVIYLDLPVTEITKRLGDIRTRGVAMPNGNTVDDIYRERTPLYRKYADITLDCTNLTAEQCVDKCIQMLQQA